MLVCIWYKFFKWLLPHLFLVILLLTLNIFLLAWSWFSVAWVIACKKKRVSMNIWDKVFKSGLSKFCGREPLKNLKWYGHWFFCKISSALNFYSNGIQYVGIWKNWFLSQWGCEELENWDLCFFLTEAAHDNRGIPKRNKFIIWPLNRCQPLHY